MIDKTTLEQAIVSIINNSPIGGQRELQDALTALGYEVPQATLSRYLRKLKIIKLDGKYQILPAPSLKNAFQILRIDISEIGLIVLHTLPGHANSVAFFLDQNHVADGTLSPIMGTIAGDDTILIIPRKKNSIQDIIAIIEAHFHCS